MENDAFLLRLEVLDELVHGEQDGHGHLVRALQLVAADKLETALFDGRM